jgi:TM2 domain-containing membrane protein YozV
MSSQTMKYCPTCGAQITANSQMCPKCGAIQPTYLGETSRQAEKLQVDPAIRDAASKKITAGICGIMLGSLGVHKFVLGMTTPGIIMAAVTILTCGAGSLVMGTIGLIEGIIYLTKSDDDFYETYIVEQKSWF